ncbi:MAG: ABC transporter substrate-binding protein [Betaproteobacteria bacterium]|nr:ABC transporter substrate-binding protein [Betaproteobacteria bacterium]
MKRIAATLLLMAAFATNPAGAKTLKYATQDEPQTLDPHAAQLAVTTRLLSNVYEPLVGRDRQFKLVPWLAVSWTQPDPLTWRFKLRPGVTFHDGAPFTADDVVFSVERVLAPTSQMKSTVQGVTHAKKIDDLTVDLILKEPNPILPNHLFAFRIMNKAWSVKHKATQPQNYREREDSYSSRHANGTGPFMVKERQPDVRTVLTEHKAWWNRQSPEKGNVTEVLLLPIRSASTRLAALISGEVDFVNDPPPQDVARLRATPGLKVVESPEERVQYLVFNTSAPELVYSDVKGKNPLSDLRVRQAIGHAIDVEAIRVKVMRGLSRPIGSMVTPTEGGYAKEADKRLPLNLDKARALLSEAGYANGFGITLDCGNNQPAADICRAIPPMLAQIGLRVTPNIVPTTNYFSKLQNFDTSFYLLSWGTPTSDGLYTLQFTTRSSDGKTTGNGDGNYGRYANPALDELIDKARVETDLAKRSALMRDALLLLNREIPLLPLHQSVIPWAMKKNVHAAFPPNSVPYFFRFRID